MNRVLPDSVNDAFFVEWRRSQLQILSETDDSFEKHDGQSRVKIALFFAVKGEVGLFKKGDELVVQVGALRRHIDLPASMAGLVPGRARLENKILTVDLKEAV